MRRPDHPQLALFRYHATTGVRVSLVSLAPATGLVTGLFVFLGPGFVKSLASSLFPAIPGVHTGTLAMTLVLALLAHHNRARILKTTSGWARHLPVSGHDLRRAAVTGLVMSMAPPALGGLLLPWFSAASELTKLAYSVGFLAAVWAASSVLIPGLDRWHRLSRGVSLVLLLSGRPSYLLLAGFLALLSSTRQATLTTSRAAAALERRRPLELTLSHLPRAFDRWRVPLLVCCRSLSWRLAPAWLTSGLPLLFGFAFIHNNDLSPDHVAGSARLAALASVALFFSSCADLLSKRRPPWTFVRSLPWSCRQRALLDAAVLALLSLPLLVLELLVAPAGVVYALALLPWLALRAATATRQARATRLGAGGFALLEGLFVSGWVTLLPVAAAAFVLVTPLAVDWAGAAERQVAASRWLERSHDLESEAV